MDQALIGYFKDSDSVTRARRELQQAGFADSDLRMQAEGDNAGSPSVAAAAAKATTAIVGSAGVARTGAAEEQHSGVGGFFRSLFDTNNDPARVEFDSEAMARGSYLLVVSAADDDRMRLAEDILQRCGASDMHKRAQP